MMKIDIKTRACLIAVVIAAIIFALALPFSSSRAFADAYSFEISSFNASYDVHADRTIDVSEEVTINYTGTHNTGFLRDLPVNEGDRVYGVKVSELVNGAQTDVDYKVSLNDDLMTLDIGDTSLKHGKYTYLISYTYAVTAPKNPDALYLNVIGFGSEAAINESHVTIRLPDGFTRADLYIGNSSTPRTGSYTTSRRGR